MAIGGGRLLRGGLAGVVLITVIAIVVSVTREDDERTAAPPQEKAAPVVVATIDEERLVAERRYQGEVIAVADAALTVGEAGRVSKLSVAEGDRVEPGQRLLELDDRLAKAELGEAHASSKSIEVQERFAESRTARFRDLAEQDAVSKGEIENEEVQADRLEAESQAARANVVALSQRVQRHHIEAPFPGVVSRVHVDPGDWLTAGQPAIELVTSDRVEVHVRVPASLLDALESLETVEILGRADEAARVEASLEGVVDALEPATRTALLRLEPKARPAWLRPGSSAEVAFHLGISGGVVVPRDALVQGVADMRVVRVNGGKAEPVVVEVLARAGDRALVRAVDGKLSRGDGVVTRGNERLRPGQLVTTEGAITNPSAVGPTAPSASASGTPP